MAEQALLPRNRMQSNKAQQWLPAKGCALLHKDTLGPVAGIFLIDSFPTSDLISHNRLTFAYHTFHYIPSHSCHQCCHLYASPTAAP